MRKSRSAVARAVALAIAPVALLAALVTWGASSPAGSSPDEDYHLTSIWCGGGIREGLCEEGPTAGERRVPKVLLTSSQCFAFKSVQAASCPQPSFDVMIDTDRGNFKGDYPPVFYSVMGFFASPDVAVSVLLMRSFNALIYVALMATVFLLIAPSRRGPLVWGSLVTLVPLGMFLVPSVNPSSWAVISASTLWIALVGYFEADSWGRRAALGAVSLLSFALAAGSRGDSAAYAAVGAVVAIVLTYQRSRTYFVLAAFPVLLVVASVLTFFSLGQANAIDPNEAHPASTGRTSLLFLNVIHLPELWAGGLGTWGLGWLDTGMPGSVWFFVFLAFGGIVVWGLQRMGWRKVLAIALIVALLIVLPLQMLMRDQLIVGEGVQPRYIYPLMIILAMLCLFGLLGENARLTRGQLVFIAVGVSVANLVAQHVNLRRYVTGTDVPGFNLDFHLEWWWGFPFGPLALWGIGAVTFAIAALCLAFGVRHTAREDVERDSVKLLVPGVGPA